MYVKITVEYCRRTISNITNNEQKFIKLYFAIY